MVGEFDNCYEIEMLWMKFVFLVKGIWVVYFRMCFWVEVIEEGSVLMEKNGMVRKV